MSDVKMSEAERLAQWLESDACDLKTPHEAAAELRRLAAELSLWERLGDPHVLLAALKRGLPAQLTPEQVWHLAADDRVRLGDLEAENARLAAEVEALRADAERLNSGCILTQERDEFGEPYQRITTGIDLRAAIDAAKASGA